MLTDQPLRGVWIVWLIGQVRLKSRPHFYVILEKDYDLTAPEVAMSEAVGWAENKLKEVKENLTLHTHGVMLAVNLSVQLTARALRFSPFFINLQFIGFT